MDRNTITGFLLIFAMVIVYQLYFVPVPEVTETAQTQEIPTPEAEEQIVALPTAMDPGDDSTYVARTALLQSGDLAVTVSTDGGNLITAELQDGFWTTGTKSPFACGQKAVLMSTGLRAERVHTTNVSTSRKKALTNWC